VRVKDIDVSGTIRTDLGDLDGLAASLKEHGLIEPIVVRPEGEKFVLVAGQRRLAAAKKAGFEEIRAEVREMSTDEARAVQLAENVHRKDLNPIERAKAVQAYLEVRRAADPTMKSEAIAKELKISGSEVSNTLMLLKQDPNIQKLVEEGKLTPGHIEHVIAPLKDQLPADKLAHFAFELAKGHVDIRTAKDQAKYVLARHKGDLEKEQLAELVKKAKVKTCSRCTGWNANPHAYLTIGGRVVLVDSRGYEEHKWFADTGEFYMTPSERKWAEEEAAILAKQDKIAAKARKKEKRPALKVAREYAVFFSRAKIEEWSRAILEAGIQAGVADARLNNGRSDDYNRYYGNRVDGLAVGLKKIPGLPTILALEPLELVDGKGGKFHTRVTVGSFLSSPSQRDNIGEGRDAATVRKERAQVLAFQRTKVRVKQADDDLWPVTLGGFQLGEKVRLGPKAEWSSYVGKQGVILAFDAVRFLADAPSGGKDVDAAVILDIAPAHKIHWLASAAKLEKKPAKKGRK
jgi:ParB/RepB/Spo0J family partition protein